MAWTIMASLCCQKHLYSSIHSYETLKQQWVSLIVAQHSTFPVEKVPKSDSILHKSWGRVVFGSRYDMMFPIRGLYMLLEALSIISIH